MSVESGSTPKVTPRPVIVPRWVPIALGEIGVVEGRTPSRIGEYHAVTRGGIAPDAVAWCSSFLCWVFEAAGVQSTRSKAAVSWLGWGEPCPVAEFGSVLVFGKADRDAAGTGHVGLCLGVSWTNVYVLGGNQANAVTIAMRRLPDVKAARRPSSAMLLTGR